MNGNSELVFVYGTLRVGASNHHRMKGAEWVGTGVVRGKLYQVSWYPGLVPDDQGGEVIGDVYLVGSGLLGELDSFEGVPDGELRGEEYERRKVGVEWKSPPRSRHDETSQVEAWAWVWHGPIADLTEVPTGDWLDVNFPKQGSWYTGFGCLGLLALPFGGVFLLETFGFLTGRGEKDHAVGILLLVSGFGGFWAAALAMQRRERGEIGRASCRERV